MRREDPASKPAPPETLPWETRLAFAEAEAARLSESVAALRAEWELRREDERGLRVAYDELRDAVLRYAVACGAVEVQVAMMRARGDGGGELAENLRRSIEEQTEASNALRALARTFQGSGSPTR